MTPSDHISDWALYSLSIIISGAIYKGLTQKVVINSFFSNSLAKPKSDILILLLCISMFFGLCLYVICCFYVNILNQTIFEKNIYNPDLYYLNLCIRR